jgi:hypothetical protein
MIQTGSRYGMVTMEDYVKGLVEAGSIDRETAREALMQVSEAVDSREEGRASAALGGGKIQTAQPEAKTRVAPPVKSPVAEKQTDKGGADDSDGGYSF